MYNFADSFGEIMLKNLKGKEDFDSSNILVFLYYWRKPVIIITLSALIASVIFSAPFFIPPKYKSTVIMYPVSTSSISKALLSENSGDKRDIMELGEDEQAEQMLQILNSNRIRDKIIDRYHLMEHYNIDSASRYKLTKLYNLYESNIKFRRTEFMAVSSTVYDKDPQIAANIANDIA